MSKVGLMDCNNFFVSCERLFRPDLLKKPVAVLSSNDGCIVARSQEVKELGIPMGIPYFKVKDMCKREGITLFSSNFKLYRDISKRVMHVLTREVPLVEIYSVDEAFFSLPDDVTEDDMRKLRDIVMRETGIPVSVGVADTKTLAKVAGSYAKKGTGVFFLESDDWQKEVTCGSVWGIGGRTAAKLTKEGIHTVKDFLLKDVSYYRNTFGVMGERMYMELKGTSVFGIGGEVDDEVPGSVSSTRSFHDAIHERSVLESALGYHVAHVAEKLRKGRQVASHIRVLAAPSRFSDYVLRKSSADIELPEPTSDTHIFLYEALRLLDTIYDPEIPYKKAGFIVSGILPLSYLLSPLFKDEKDDLGELYETTDTLNSRFGAGTVRPGIVQKTERWRESATLKSQEYTTKWEHIRTVKAI